MAFDKTLISIMLKNAYQSGLDDGKWLYWQNMHKNSKKVIKWKGAKSELFEEQKGVRQGSSGAEDAYKNYTSKMLFSLESLSGVKRGNVPLGGHDQLANHPATVVAVADDTAPSSRHTLPRVALSDLQTLLYVTEAEARQLHIEFNVQKCQLLVTARPGKLQKTLKLLEEEPDILTFYSQPVSIIKPGDHYVHLGVPQATTGQTKIAVNVKMKSGMEMFYSL